MRLAVNRAFAIPKNNFMGEIKLINSYCFTATNTVRSTATIVVLIVSLSVACGEDLTTLDGKTFTNITAIAKYPKQVFFNCDGKRIGVAITNLKESFRAKYGINISTNAVTVSGQQTNSVDLYFANHSNSTLTVEREKSKSAENSYDSWTITVMAKGFELRSGTIIGPATSTNNLNIQQSASFKFNQEAFVSAALNKVVDWGKIASENDAESFEKPIGSLPDDILGDIGESNSYTFHWDKDSITRGYYFSGPGFIFNQKSVTNFVALMQLLPSLKEELADKIKRQEAQQLLFK